MKCANWPSSYVEGNVNCVTNMDHRKVRRVLQNQSEVRMKISIRSQGCHLLKNRLLHQSHPHHLQRLPLSAQALSSSGNLSYAALLKRRFLDRRVRLEPQDAVPEVVADRDLRPRVAVVRLLPALLAGGMTIVPGDEHRQFVPLRGRITARDRGLRKGFATVTVIEIVIAIAIEVGTVANLPEPTDVARAAVSIGEDRGRILGSDVGRALERVDLDQSREANIVPVIIAGIDRLR